MITPFDPDLDERVCCISADDYENTLKATDYVLDKVIKDPEGYVSKNLMYNGPADVYSRQSYGGGGGGGGRHGYPDYGKNVALAGLKALGRVLVNRVLWYQDSLSQISEESINRTLRRIFGTFFYLKSD